MKKAKLTKRDFIFLNHALDILESDYQDRGLTGDKILSEIERMKKKLALIEADK